jgi:pyochelin biosynthetic protein PchC
MGAAVAYEVARRLEARGLFPERLVASGRHAPHHDRIQTVHLLDDDDFWARLRELGGTSELLLSDPQVRRILAPALRGDYRVAETYLAREPTVLRTPVTVFRAAADPEMTAEDTAGWAELTTGGLDEQVFPGGHFYLMADHRAVLAAVIARLDAVLLGPAGPGVTQAPPEPP